MALSQIVFEVVLITSLIGKNSAEGPVNSVSTEVFKSLPDGVFMIEGNPAVFECIIQGAKPAPNISQVAWYIELLTGNNESLPGIPGNPITSNRTTSISLSYTARRQDLGLVFCTATNDWMVSRGIPAVTSSNKIQLYIQSRYKFLDGCPAL
ncbi:uncharacterized protein LOC121386132 [Gigantopelta aegis]|uniref:uncharacterized protein LOC121386132 n=1 Tax=Gigantopelta aegis TaxID=1735272 RepID=UPI001B888D3D|nr:uncharacterized protein LOC121386132 [Gigantopelta aegis]